MRQDLASQDPTSQSAALVLSTEQTSTLTRQLIERIPQMSDEELIQCAKFSQELDKSAYLIRGAVGAEIRKRYQALSGRSKDREGTGRKARLRQLAEQHDISLRAIEDDAAIYTTFVEGSQENSAGDITVLPLKREYYRLALQTTDPQATIQKVLEEKREDPGYSTRDFRAYVNSLKQPKRRKVQATEDLAPFRLVIEGAHVIVQTGKDNTVAVVLPILKKAVQQLQEELSRQH